MSRRLAPILFVLAAVAASPSARAESIAYPDTGIDAMADTSVPDAIDDADDSAVSDDASPDVDPADATDASDTEAPDTELPDTQMPDTQMPDTQMPDTQMADTRDSAPPAMDTTVVDTGETYHPPFITEDPSDPFLRDPNRDACKCTAPGRASDAGVFAALIGLLVIALRRSHPTK